MLNIKRTYKKILCGSLAALLLAGSFGCGSQQQAADEASWGRADAKEIDINSKIAGRVVELLVKEGDTVQKDQVLARIDKRDLLTQKAQLEASIQAIEAQQLQASYVTNLQSGTTQSSLAQAQAALEKAQSDLELTRTDNERFKELLASGAVAQQTYDNYRTKYEVAQAQAAQAQAAVAQAQSGLLQTPANQANEAALARKLDQAKAQLEQLEVSLDETEIRAPFDGVITQKYIEAGSMISQGTPLVAVQDPMDNWVDLKVPETKLADYKLDQQLTLVGRDGKTKVQGTITDISKKAEFATQRATSERGDESDIVSFNVKIQVNSELLRPGMRFRLLGDAS